MIPNLNHKQTFKLSIDKILFIFACTYLTMMIFWLVGQEKLKLPGMANSSNQSTDQKQTLSPKDAQFIAYLQQSLEMLERKQQQQNTANSKPTSKVIPPKTIKVPPAPLPSSPPSTPTTPQVIEKIYIPIYPQMQQPTVAVNSAPPVIAIKPPSPTRLNVPPPPLPVPSPSTIQPPKTPSTVPVLTPGVAFVPEETPSTPSTNTTNSTGLLLVGLLEAGDKSSALFTINGQTQRIQLGEGIGTTGWMLKSVQNQQAVITRNSTVRYLGVGQNF